MLFSSAIVSHGPWATAATSRWRARALRIFPGAIETAAAYLFHSRTALLAAKNSTLLFGVWTRLPGVFLDNPMKGTVNGSLWTLPFEVRLYLLLGLLWWATSRWSERLRWLRFDAVIVLLASVALAVRPRPGF